jgi:cysteine-rich repeat protein
MSSIAIHHRHLYLFAALLTLGGVSGCVSVFSADESAFVEGSDDTSADTSGATSDDTSGSTSADTSGTATSGDTSGTATNDDTSGSTSADTSGATAEDADADTNPVNMCEDSALNGDETDLDCGGSCAPCANYRFCQSGADCINKVCDPDEGICSPPTCLDGAANGQETDLDCGGPNCNECADGLLCIQNSDCEAGFCYQGVCTGPSCTDQLRNGGESDIDCGGPSCAPCAPTQRCDTFSDCDSDVCNGQGRCAEPTCDDGARNGAEVGVDCGADSGCGLCGDGEACTTMGDCVSGVCDSVNGTCRAPACDDTVRNGDETDIDCGGAGCSPCPDGLGCLVGGDCASLICDASTLQCVNAGCVDNVRNGFETDVDCGGPSCAPCGLNLQCNANSDCVSNKCRTNNPKVCVAPVCGDGLVGPGEQCDDGNSSSTDGCVSCEVARCGDSFVRQGVEQCDDGNASNTDGCTSACQNAVCGDRFVRQGVEQCDDGNASNTDLCTTSCTLTSCTDNARNADETDIDCGGRCGATCPIGKACSGDEDCAEGLCQGGVCAYGSSCMALLSLGQTDSRVYTIDVDGPFGGKPAFQAYCDQQTDGGGWTLAMKVPSENVGDQWGYGDVRWTSATAYREGDAGWDRREAKLWSAVYMPFSEVMLALEVPARRDPEAIVFDPLILRVSGASLTQLFSQGQRIDTSFGRGEWAARAGGISLPNMMQCDKEGFNIDLSSIARARVGFVSSVSASCSYGPNNAIWIGMGSQGQACGGAPADAVVGFSSCDGLGVRDWARGFGALFVR